MAYLNIRLLFCLFISIIVHLLILSGDPFILPSSEPGKVLLLHTRISPLSVAKTYATEETVGINNKDRNKDATIGHLIDAAPISKNKTSSPAWKYSPVNSKIDDYLPVSLLTKAPNPIDSIDPTPPGFMLDGLLGDTEFILLISSDGNIDEVLVVRSTLPDFFVEFAKSAFRKCHFTPGLVHETAVRSRLRISLSPSPLDVDPETGNPLSAKNRRP